MFYQRIKTFLKIRFFPSRIFTMCIKDFSTDIKTIFEAAVKSVQPANLIERAIEVHGNCIEIQGKTFSLHKNAHIVGFGKAVLGMAVALENKLKEHVVHGIVSIPEGSVCQSTTKRSLYYKQGSHIHIYEGASNNIPDENSLLAASRIKEHITSLKESDLLFVLISGGGSALLPSPKPPLTLEEKQKVTTLLASKGATIDELNAVRKRLSTLKGGNLAQLARPAQVVSLILSDVIGDPLTVIASGPTVENTDGPDLPMSIIEKYNLKGRIPTPALRLLEDISHQPVCEKNNFDHVNNFILGNNRIALNAAAECASDLNYVPVIMTTELCGIASSVGEKLITLVNAALENEMETYDRVCHDLPLEPNSKQVLLTSTELLEKQRRKLCILFGGETTVDVQGAGIGGRNQELALSAALTLCTRKSKYDVCLLSAGTDGIDGPTPAAGAIATASVSDVAKSQGIDPFEFLKNNDSYTFYSSVNNGHWLVKLGHTGTNVMDIIIVLIK